MIKFFRKVRQNLLLNGKTGRYFKYAIGEIILVVIGILIALQINNWNESRKESIQELQLLEDLYSDINFNLTQIRRVYYEDSLGNQMNKSLLSLLQNPESIYHDSLQPYFGSITRYDVFYPRRTAYEALKTRGLDLIKNRNLRSDITELYDEYYMINALVLDLRKDTHLGSIELFNERFFTLAKVQNKVPTDFDALKDDTVFLNSLSHITAENENFLSHHSRMLNQTETIKERILAEIKIKSD